MIKKIKDPATINNIVNIQSVKKDNDITLKNLDGYFQEKFFFADIFDDTKLQKMIKSIEAQVRTSEEYSNYVGFLTNTIGLNHCAILGNVEKDYATVEMHHYPYTLYDIVYLTISSHILKDTKFTSFTIVKEILDDHYKNIIGITPLSKTVHELVHAGEIFVNLSQVYGDVNAFNEKYSFAMTEDLIEKFNKLVEYSNTHLIYSDTDILKKVYDIEKK